MVIDAIMAVIAGGLVMNLWLFWQCIKEGDAAKADIATIVVSSALGSGFFALLLLEKI